MSLSSVKTKERKGEERDRRKEGRNVDAFNLSTHRANALYIYIYIYIKL